MTIYTTYFAKLKKLPKDIIPIAICGRCPEGWVGLRAIQFAPRIGFFKEYKETGDEEMYRREFKAQVLDQLNPVLEYEKLRIMGQGKDVALVCYETPEKFCHRHLVADWFSSNGIEVKEYVE